MRYPELQIEFSKLVLYVLQIEVNLSIIVNCNICSSSGTLADQSRREV
jgi:hypothetical protein